MDDFSQPFVEYLDKKINGNGLKQTPISKTQQFWMALLFFVGIGLIWMIVAYSKHHSQKKAIFNELPPVEDLYKKYFELCYEPYPDYDGLEFVGLIKDGSLIRRSSGMKFKYKGQDYIYNSRDYKKVVSNGQQTVVYYTFKDATKFECKAVDEIKNIKVTNNSGFMNKKRKNLYANESISFNNKYLVSGEDKLQIARLFTPAVIDNLDGEDGYEIPGTIVINKGIMEQSFKSPKSKVPWYAEPAFKKGDFKDTGDLVYVITDRISGNFLHALDTYEFFNKLNL